MLTLRIRAELGRATWKYFHTMLARYPEDPTEEQQETLRSYIYLFARLYPWYSWPLFAHSASRMLTDKLAVNAPHTSKDI
jgi:hypothetical protein